MSAARALELARVLGLLPFVPGVKAGRTRDPGGEGRVTADARQVVVSGSATPWHAAQAKAVAADNLQDGGRSSRVRGESLMDGPAEGEPTPITAAH